MNPIAVRPLVPLLAVLTIAAPLAAQPPAAAPSGGSSRTAEPPAAGDPASDRVAPGLVRWHPYPGAAREASAISKKPVLHFQLLGRLDERFP